MMILMFSTAGVPPLVGFWAKVQVITAVLHMGLTWLAVLAVVFSVIGAYFYLRVVKLMYFDAPANDHRVAGSAGFRWVLSLNALLVLALGVAPGWLLEICAQVLP
jgi:NADH-quinone oxidoreductase subunit N